MKNRIRIIEGMLWLIRKVIKRWRIDGPWKTMGHLIKQPRRRILDPYIIEPYHDWRLGIKAGKVVYSSDLGLPGEQYHHYVGAGHRDFKRAMKHVKVTAQQDVFLDYGSGKGRALVMAGKYPFKRIIGVEYSAELNQTARENVNRARRKLKCKDISVVTADASTWALPNDVTVIYLFNPFDGEILAQSFERIHESLLAAPRTITIVYGNPLHFEPIADRFAWVVKKHEFYYYYQYKYAIYECVVE